MEKKRKWLVPGIVLVILIGSGLTYLIQRQSSVNTSQQSLTTTTVSRGDIQSTVHALGTVDSASTRIFKADNPETIDSVLVQPGAKVEANQNLLTFVNQDLQSSIADAKANLQTAEIDAASAQRSLDENNASRIIGSSTDGKVVAVNTAAGQHVQAGSVIAVIQNSSSNNNQVVAKTSGIVQSISVKNGDTTQSGQTVATLEADSSLQDNVSKANIALQQAKDKLNALLYTEKVPPIQASFAGTVAAVDVQNGDVVQKGDPLVEVVDLTRLQMILPVDELDILKVKTGQTVQVTLNAMPNTPITGKVDSIAELGNVQNGVSTFSVTVSLNETPGVMPGMTGEAYIITSEKKNILELPLEAVQEKNGHPFVMVETSDGKQVMQKIKTGTHDDQAVEVTSGLKEGDKVVIPKSYTITNKGKKQKKTKNKALNKMFGGGKGGK